MPHVFGSLSFWVGLMSSMQWFLAVVGNTWNHNILLLPSIHSEVLEWAKAVDDPKVTASGRFEEDRCRENSGTKGEQDTEHAADVVLTRCHCG